MQDYWHKQAAGQPLFPGLLWSRPENRALAGKLLIVGGNAHGFAAPAAAYNLAEASGIGVARVALPDALQRALGFILESGEYLPSTPSGSFSRSSLAELLSLANWADGVLLAGDFGRNSETAILLEALAAKYSGPLVVTRDAADYFVNTPRSVVSRPQTLLVISFAQLQRLARESHYPHAFTYSLSLPQLVSRLHDFSQTYAAHIVVRHLDKTLVAAGGQVSSTAAPAGQTIWRLQTASRAAVWWLQNPGQPFEAVTSSLYLD